MLIRTEAPVDILAVDRLLKSCFETPAEAKLVKKLRENSRFTVSMVACTDEGELIGHALFTPVTLNGEDLGWQGLAPLAVAKDQQGKGVARALIESGLESLAELGYPACVVLGSPEFYTRFGFEDAAEYAFDSIYHQMDEYVEGAFQVKALADGVFDNHQGRIEYSPEFSLV